MIVPMKKVYLVILESRRRESLSRLKKIGVVHVENAGKSSRELEELQDSQGILQRAISVLPLAKREEKSGKRMIIPEAVELAREIGARAEKLRLRRDETEKLSREIERVSPWGDYNPETLRLIEARGVPVRLYEFKKEDLKKLPDTGKRFVVYQGKSGTGVAWVARKEEEFPRDFEPLPIPQKGLTELEQLYKIKQGEVRSYEEEIARYSGSRELLEKALEKLAELTEFEQVCADLAVEERIAYLSGFVPVTKLDELKTAAGREGWALLVQDPPEGEAVPTLVENPRWIGIIRPIFDFLGTVPGYREIDISFFFLVFFSFFFAMIIGDAAYGAILFCLSVYFAAKAKKKTGMVPDALLLFIIMGTGTLVWGAITGNWFGFEPISRVAPFSWFVIPSISSWNPRSSDTIKFITFIVGTVHLSIAHVWNFLREIKKKPLIRAFAQLGWLSMVLGLYFLVLNMVLDPIKYPVPGFAKIMILVGFLMVLFLSQQEGNFFKGLIKGLGGFITTFLNSISAFSDIISYIRLFAVGLASIEIAKSFNGMSEGLMTSPSGIVFGCIVVVLGHGLNMAMSGLSVIVHGVRLNVLEFSNHLGLEWSGFLYRPFREKEEQSGQSNLA